MIAADTTGKFLLELAGPGSRRKPSGAQHFDNAVDLSLADVWMCERQEPGADAGWRWGLGDHLWLSSPYNSCNTRGTLTLSANSRSTLRHAAEPNWRRRCGSSTSRRIAPANACGLLTGTRKPVAPSSTTSRQPTLSVVTIGLPIAIAS